MDQAKVEGFPTGEDKEPYFLEQVQEAEALSADRKFSRSRVTPLPVRPRTTDMR